MATSSRNSFRAEESAPKPSPSMQRSKGQLSASYAPGAFFTFEGGLGACVSTPDQSNHPDEALISEATKGQISLRLQEIWQSWLSRAHAVGGPERPIDPRQCLDEPLLFGPTVRPLGLDRMAFLSPLRMGYAPAPLTLVCNKCRLFASFKSAKDLSANIGRLRSDRCDAQPTSACQWRQLDVVFVHWSGEWQPVMPARWEWDNTRSEAYPSGEYCGICRGRRFRLNTDSPQIGRWHFYCANKSCGHKRDPEWRQNDKFTTEIFADQSSKRISERRMEPISYRASAAYYPQSEQFVLFKGSEENLLSLLEPHKQADLLEFIGTKFGYPGTALTPEVMRESLLAAGKASEWDQYQSFSDLLTKVNQLGDQSMVKQLETLRAELVTRWTSAVPPLVAPQVDLPSSVKDQLNLRSEYTSRYDPFVLAVEHDALEKGKLSAGMVAGRAPFVRFNRLDHDLSPKDEDKKKEQEDQTTSLLGRLGMAEAGLIREFDLCRFTHGYTRVSPTPTMEKRGQQMPVRLRLFEPIHNNKRPIYVVTQGNEAIYVQLDSTAVYRWLSAIGVKDLPHWDPSGPTKLGGRILEVAQPFGRYFSQLREGDAATYRYVYTLLHTYAHSVMKGVAEFSGLDLGSMGEYIFPLDLAFVVYRSGTTMDLGNLSSLWRNSNNLFLKRLLEADTHRCNSGRLCDVSGGACPDCVMMPETSCIAQNRLLSRAVLRGGPAPKEDLTHKGQRIPGFLELLNSKYDG